MQSYLNSSNDHKFLMNLMFIEDLWFYFNDEEILCKITRYNNPQI